MNQGKYCNDHFLFSSDNIATINKSTKV